MGDDKRGVDFAFLDSIEQLRQIMLHRCLDHAEGEAAVNGRSDRYLIDETAIDADSIRLRELVADDLLESIRRRDVDFGLARKCQGRPNSGLILCSRIRSMRLRPPNSASESAVGSISLNSAIIRSCSIRIHRFAQYAGARGGGQKPSDGYQM
jgi:hypothetical protein